MSQLLVIFFCRMCRTGFVINSGDISIGTVFSAGFSGFSCAGDHAHYLKGITSASCGHNVVCGQPRSELQSPVGRKS